MEPNQSENSTPPAAASSPSAPLEAALDYLRRGWSVLPVGGDKRPLLRWAEFQQRRPSETEVRGWFAHWPDAGVGIVTGKVSGLAVLDVDPRNGGNNTLDDLVAQGHRLPDTPLAWTGGGGSHHYFAAQGDTPTIPALAPGIDLKAEGSYVVAPPSIHPSGRRYEWAISPDMAPLAPVPDWLLALITAKGQVAQPFALPPTITEGGRNDTLFRLACAMRDKGMELPGVMAALQAENIARCDPPLSPKELEAIAGSALRYQPSAPAQDNGKKQPAEPYPTTLWAALTNGHLPPIPWLVEGLLPEANALIIGGFSAYGKSWLLLTLAASIASQRPWLDHFRTRGGAVLYIDEENSEFELRRRLHRLTAGYGFDAKSLSVHFCMGTGLRLSDRAGMARLEATIQAVQPKVVMADTLIRILGYDENDATKVAQGFARIKDLMNRYTLAFVFADHHRKPTGFDSGPEMSLRGSTDKTNFVDSILTIRRSKASGQHQVSHTKARFGAAVPPFGFQISDVGPEATILSYEVVAEEEERATLLAEAKEEVIALFPAGDIALGFEEIRQKVEAALGETISEKWLRQALQELVRGGKLAKRGKRGPGVRYGQPEVGLEGR
ncbi:MAG: bifunctional DNA primase/polymerase [Chloroflexota bacterium]